MIRTILLSGAFVVALIGCDFKSKREVALEHEADSLREELTVSSALNDVLVDVGVIIDSIDASRNFLSTGIVEGPPHSGYVSRLHNIWEHIEASTKKIDELELKLKQSQSAQNKNLALIKKLKDDLLVSQNEITRMTEQIANYQEETASLMNTVALQGAELSDKMELLDVRQAEVVQLQKDIDKIVAQGKFDLAEAYFKQAEALEEAARRTKLAPRKKRSTQQEALELYHLSLATGKEEAREKIAALEKNN